MSSNQTPILEPGQPGQPEQPEQPEQRVRTLRESLPEAIARQEGFYIDCSLAARNHNPGNIKFGAFAQRYKANRDPWGFAIFATDEVGWSALKGLLLTETYRDLTVEQCIYKWAPPSENDSAAYLQNVCAWCYCMADTPIAELIV